MCGIIGFLNRKTDNTPLGENTIIGLKKAMIVQRHRGPDDEGACGFRYDHAEVFEESDAIRLNRFGKYDGLFGFNRLSIKDLSMEGHQPMLSADKKVILLFNGEIYNDQELREDLRKQGYSFKSTTDTEVILNLYLNLGFQRMLPLLNGMFAIAIMDLRTKKLHMARDRFGIKPCYYTFTDEYFMFASELKCFIQFDEFERKLDIDAVNARLIFSRPSSKVLFQNVYMLDPGEALTMSVNGSINKWRYFSVDSYRRNDKRDIIIDDVLGELDEILFDAIKRQMVSDVKVGCQVSGGIDSTLVSYYANKIDGSNLKDGVSIIDNAGETGEEHYINIVGDKLGIDSHKFKVQEEFFLENYEKLIWHCDAPLYKPYFASFYKLTQGAKEYVTVLLSGEGADEVGGGYNKFAAGVFQPFITARRIQGKGLRCFNNYAEYAVLSEQPLLDFTTKGYTGVQHLVDEQIDAFNSFEGSNFTKQIKYETVYNLPESFMRQDKMSMANSIENRVPLVDNKVVDFLMELPEEMLIRFKASSPVLMEADPFQWVHGKFILKELCARIFGHDFAYRKKEIMVFDDKNMLASSGFQQVFYDKILPSMKERDLLDSNKIEFLYSNVLEISNREFNVLWRSIGFESWCQLFFDGRGKLNSTLRS